MSLGIDSHQGHLLQLLPERYSAVLEDADCFQQMLDYKQAQMQSYKIKITLLGRAKIFLGHRIQFAT